VRAAIVAGIQHPLQMLFSAWLSRRFSSLMTASLLCSWVVVGAFGPGMRVPLDR
jgi:hypothetical protein